MRHFLATRALLAVAPCAHNPSRRGTYRLGLLLAAICWLPGSFFVWVTVMEELAPPNSSRNVLASMGLGVALYCLSAGIGWVIAGFAGDDQISN